MVAVSLPAGELQRRFRLDDAGPGRRRRQRPRCGRRRAGRGQWTPRPTCAGPRSRAATLQTTHAFHSRMLAGLCDDLTALGRGPTSPSTRPTLPYISNVTGELADAALVCDPGYWARHMCETVQFAAAAGVLLADAELAVVEIGPGQSLGALVRAAGCPPQRWPLILNRCPAAATAARHDEVLTGLPGPAMALGVDLDWEAYHGRRGRRTRPGVCCRVSGRCRYRRTRSNDSGYWIDPRPRPVAAAAVGAQPGVDPDHLFEAITNLPRLPEDQWTVPAVWRQAPPPASGSSQQASWLVYTRDGLADQSLEELRHGAAATVTWYAPATAYACTPDGSTRCGRPGRRHHRLLRDLRGRDRSPDRVVHLWTRGIDDEESTVVRACTPWWP